MENNLQNRRGKISLNRDMMLSCQEDEMKALFSKFYPIAINQDNNLTYLENYFYYGFSPDFKEVEQGVEVPEYIAIFTRHEATENSTGAVSVEFVVSNI